MRLKSIATSAVAFRLFVFVQVAVAAPPNDACDLPKDLQREVASKYPGKRVVTLADLQADDRGFFQADHDNGCPGLVKVDFYGDGKPTLALVLIGKDEAKESAVLVVAHQVEAIWNITMLATGGPTVPVVWEFAHGRVRGRLWQEDNSSDQTRYRFHQVRGVRHPLRRLSGRCQGRLLVLMESLKSSRYGSAELSFDRKQAPCLLIYTAASGTRQTTETSRWTPADLARGLLWWQIRCVQGGRSIR